ncbi:MAG: glycosyltransferase [Chitinispirillaceae bacterium]|nr:glycosyltransferase [Chitinispirillaceae bacterium]
MSDTMQLIQFLTTWTAVIFLVVYALLHFYLLFMTMHIPERKKSTDSPIRENVSIVIPVKNEVQRLGPLLASLDRLCAPGELEILFIDDHSDDGSIRLLEDYASTRTGKVKILSNPYNPSRKLTSKQQALEHGISMASFDLIALTDADMELHPDWLMSLCDALDNSTVLVFGHTVIAPVKNFFYLLQSLQLEFLFTVAVLFHYARISGSCMGNNLLVRKSVYRECGGQQAIGYSIAEDRALLRLFHKCKRKTGIVAPFTPTARTVPHETFSGFIHQVARWATGGFSCGRNLFFFGSLFLMHILLCTAAAGGIMPFFTGITALISFCCVWLVVFVMFARNRSGVTPLIFPLFYPMVIVETIAITILFLSGKKLHWKKRSI